ncbi:MAG TPA: ABC transporter permease [Candidatus Limnocylindrales bacterium]|nr:ABC transporter permease [Candidatus Limnocylindrales bacterium]
MIWLAWRQHRKQALFGLGVVALLALIMIPSGIAIHRSFVDTGYAACLDGFGRAEFVPLAQVNGCEQARDAFRNGQDSWQIFATLLIFLPLLAGMFWGAPLVARETEAGTHHLVWTQGVTRRRWALTKFGLVGLGVLFAAVAYSLLLTWWVKPLSRATGGGFGFLIFDLHGIVPIGYTLFALAVGILAGAVTRKVLPAMAVTLVGFVAVRALVEFAARPFFLAPKSRTFKVATTEIPNPASQDWLLSYSLHDSNGPDSNGGYAFCEPSVTCPDEGWFNFHVYQPGDRFWLFQYIETGIYLALTALLLYLAIRLVRRRIT